jgi:cell division protein FtsB
LLIAGIIQVAGLWRKLSLLQETASTLQKKLNAIESDTNAFRAELRVSESFEAMERDAKSRFNLKKPGEEVVVVVREPDATSSPEEKKTTWWDDVTGFFSGLFR